MQGKEQKGNNKAIGRPCKFDSPTHLYEECVKYFKHCDNTPWVKIDFKVVAGELKKIEIPTQRPYTWAGLCTFLGVNRKYFYDFQENCSEEFSDIISYVRDIIEGNKIEGALVGAYN